MSSAQALISFPASGRLAIGSSGAPSSSGTAPVTGLRNILDKKWIENILGKAGEKTCLSPTGLTDGTESGFSLTGLGSVLEASRESLEKTIGDLVTACAIGSLAAGLCNSVSSTTAAMFVLLDEASSTADASRRVKLVGLARKLAETSGRAVDLFSDAFQMAGQGLIGIEGADPGELLSGGLGKIASLAGSDGSSAQTIALDSDQLSEEFEAMGIEAPLLPPSAGLNEICAALPSNESAASDGGDIGSALSKLNEDTIRKVEKRVKEALLVSASRDSESESMVSRPSGVKRAQGLTMLDGSGFGTPFSSSLSASARTLVATLAGSSFADSKASSRSWSPIEQLVESASKSGVTTDSSILPPVSSGVPSTSGDWQGTAESVLDVISSVMAEACAFNTLLSASLDLPDLNVESLLPSLECRRSTFAGLSLKFELKLDYDKDLLRQLRGLVSMMIGGRDLCSPSSLPLGSCLK